MTFNPSAPLVLGEEWIPPLSLARSLSDDATGWADIFTAQATESVESVWLYARSIPQSGKYIAEVFLLGAEDPGSVSPYTAVPTSDVASYNVFGAPGIWLGEDLRAINLYTSIADSSHLTFIFSSGFGARYQMSFATGAFLGGTRPVTVQVVVDIGAFGGRATDVGIADSVTGLNYKIATLNYAGEQFFTLDVGQINPFTGAPWTPTDINQFAAGGRYSIMVTDPSYVLDPIGEAWEITLSVPWVPDNRLAWSAAVGIAHVTGGLIPAVFPRPSIPATAWVEFPLLAPWNKVSGTTYAVVVRRVQSLSNVVPSPPPGWPGGGSPPQGGGAITLGYLDGDPRGCPNASHRTGKFAVSSGLIAGSPVLSPLAGLAVVYQLGSAAGSVDSQPYAVASGAHVDGSTVAQQEYTPAVSGPYGRVRVYVAANPDATTPLHASINRRSDDVIMSSVEILTVAELAALTAEGGSVSGWTLWDFTFATPGPLIAGTQYYLDLSAPDEPSGTTVGFQILYLDTLVGISGNGGDDATFGATGDRATINGVESSDRDLAATIAELPDPPSDVVAVLAELDLAELGTLCEIASVGFARLTWTPTELDDLFGRYGIERSDDGGATWVPIASITTEAISEFRDFEGRRGLASSYRIKVYRTDGTSSIPVDAGDVTPTCSSSYWIFTSNENPAATLAYQKAPDQQFERAADLAVERPMFGRDDTVVFRPLERPGDRFPLSLIVAGPDYATPGRAAFDPLVDLAESVLSYVCVLEPDSVTCDGDRSPGERWFASLSKLHMLRNEPSDAHTMILEVLEVCPLPSQVDVGVC